MDIWHMHIWFTFLQILFYRTNAMWAMLLSTWLVLFILFHYIRFESMDCNIIILNIFFRLSKESFLSIEFHKVCNWYWLRTANQNVSYISQAFNGKKWEKFNCEKVASIAYAQIQGKTTLTAHFQNSSLMNEDKHCRPILFHTDGPNAGDQVGHLT